MKMRQQFQRVSALVQPVSKTGARIVCALRRLAAAGGSREGSKRSTLPPGPPPTPPHGTAPTPSPRHRFAAGVRENSKTPTLSVEKSGEPELVSRGTGRGSGETGASLGHGVQGLIAERGRTHGKFLDQARCAQALKTVMRESLNWGDLPSPAREALENDAIKTARILCGDWRHLDHWDDRLGYIELGREAVREARVDR